MARREPARALLFIAFVMTFVRPLHDVGRSGRSLLLTVISFAVMVLDYWATKCGDPLLNKFGGRLT
jgi:uncharacterized membrane protein YhaH (DUF805 family)